MTDEEKATHPVFTRLPTGIISQIDALVAENMYTNRGDFIREAVRVYLQEIEDRKKYPFKSTMRFTDSGSEILEVNKERLSRDQR